MKNLFKLLVIVLLLGYGSQSFAQTFAAKAGLNLTNMLSKDDDETYSKDFKTKVGFHIGGTAEFEITEMFSFETGLFLSTQGYKVNTSFGDFTTNLLYVNIPLTGKARYELDDFNIYGLFGPCVGLGLSGKVKSGGNSSNIDWGSGEDNDLKRFDFGWIIGAGIEYGPFVGGLQYQLGLANIAASNEDGFRVKNRVFQITFGYRFGLD